MPVNMIPERLTDFMCYDSDSNSLKGVADIQLPSFDPLKDTVKGAGIAGEYESPNIGQFGSMKLTFSWRTITKDQFSLMAQKSQKWECRGALQVYDSAAGTYSIVKVRVVVQGPPMKSDPGKMEKNSGSGGTSEIEAIYIKIEYDGVTKVEIDKLNYKCSIDGVDYLQDVRTALGIE